MKIIAYEDRVDLRKVTAKSKYLRHVARTYKVKDQQAVCFTNKALNRFRLVFKINNALFMCVPEIDETSKYSVYLRISEELSALTGIKSKIHVQLGLLSEFTKERIKRQHKHRRRAKKKSKS